jgi:hypothetical protein
MFVVAWSAHCRVSSTFHEPRRLFWTSTTSSIKRVRTPQFSIAAAAELPPSTINYNPF